MYSELTMKSKRQKEKKDMGTMWRRGKFERIACQAHIMPCGITSKAFFVFVLCSFVVQH